MLPLSYAIRNLFRSKSRLAQTVGGSALVVLLVMTAVAINDGMTRILSASGSPYNVILVGAGSEESIQRSEVPDKSAGIAETAVSGVAEKLGIRAVSSEIHYMNYVRLPDGTRSQALLRGVTPAALRTHPEVRIVEGSYPASGEVMVGRLAWRKLGIPITTLKPGQPLNLDGRELKISGVFAAPGTVMESEIWAPLGDLRVLAQRETLSCVVLRLTNPDDFSEAELFTKQRLDLELSALRESDYYARITAFFRPLRGMIWITAGLIAAGAVFGGVNTLYAAFAPRIREMAALQAIGFSRTSLLASLIQESLLACLLGTLLASVVALLFLEGRTVAFSIGAVALEISPQVASAGLLTGVLLGILGATPPAVRCLKPALSVALRAS
jgi:putative ABC transport system permease protein